MQTLLMTGGDVNMAAPMRAGDTSGTQKPTVSDAGQSDAVSTRVRHGPNSWPRVLGVLVSLTYGIGLPNLPVVSPAFNLPLAAVALAGVGLLGGLLIRMRRAVAVVPVAFFAGLVVGHVLHGWYPAAFPIGELIGIVPFAVLLWSLPLVIGVACGLPLGIWLEERLSQRGGRPDAHSSR